MAHEYVKWTAADKAAMQQFADRAALDCDDIKVKEQIRKTILNNRFILHALHNTELEESEADPDEYYLNNILPYYLIKPTQSAVKNFICYTVDYDELERYNSCMKLLTITFVILCEQKNIIDEETMVPRHDLLAALLYDQFNWTQCLGPKIHLIEDKESVVDTDYACRTLVFQQHTDNNLVKSRNVNGEYKPILSNKVMVFPSEKE